MYMTGNVPLRLKRIIRAAMQADIFFESDEFSARVHAIRRKLNKRYPDTREIVTGKYSGLTRAELARTGTCETDWY